MRWKGDDAHLGRVWEVNDLTVGMSVNIPILVFGISVTMPPVKPQRMALEVIISICCAFSGYLAAVEAMVGGVMAMMGRHG